MSKLEAGQVSEISIRVNGVMQTARVEPRTTLADCLRNELGLTGTHLGCEHGVCGACTVHVDGVTARSCLMLAAQAQGHEVDTVESLAPAQELNDLQTAFRELHGLQCGFCTAGILMTLMELMRDNPDAGEEDVRVALSGHICRCTGYHNIVKAAMATLDARRNALVTP